MKLWQYKIASTSRIALVTLNVLLLLAILVDSYIKNSWGTWQVLALVIVGLNILTFIADRPQKPDSTTNNDFQNSGQAAEGK